MKIRLVFLTLLGVLCLNCSEPNNQTIEYKFELINNTAYKVVIKAYDTKEPVKTETRTVLEGGQVYEKTFYSRPSDRGYFYSDVLQGDSIEMIYDNARMKTFYCFRNNNNEGCDEEGNILSEFSDLDERDRIILNRYEFTTEDYEHAVPCNGDCE